MRLDVAEFDVVSWLIRVLFVNPGNNGLSPTLLLDYCESPRLATWVTTEV